jgi:uracil-DNA glycosylase
MSTVQIEESWKQELTEAFEKPSFQGLVGFLKKEKGLGKTILPPGPQIFEAFNRTPFSKVKVVLLGQDPYHGLGQAHGLCFSVNDGIAFPPSLVNIFKGLSVDYPNYKIPKSGNLSAWADEGVLLLNATLTVRLGEAGSHQNKGWEEFTDTVITTLSEKREHLVFMLWGSYAQNKSVLINTQKHLVLKAPHPSPLSAYRGFFDCRHFSQVNAYLAITNQTPIQWQL